MNDLEISKALAMAIGWESAQIFTTHDGRCGINRPQRVGSQYSDAVYFDYRDPAVIWPIAERYDCFPDKITGGLNEGKWISFGQKNFATAETPSKAAALAVIGNNK